MTSLVLLKLAASIFGFSLFILFCNFVAMWSEMKNSGTPAWWMVGIHIVFGLLSSISGLTALVAGIIWLVKNLPA
jgi:hypothetical protein